MPAIALVTSLGEGYGHTGLAGSRGERDSVAPHDAGVLPQHGLPTYLKGARRGFVDDAIEHGDEFIWIPARRKVIPRIAAPGPGNGVQGVIPFAHGFAHVLNRKALSSVEVKDGEPSAEVRDLPLPERIRRVLEALGPTFVKLGQILSTRADIVPEHYAEALQSLRGDVSGLAVGAASAVLGRDLDTVGQQSVIDQALRAD